LRKNHGAAPLEVDKTAGSTLQKALNDITAADFKKGAVVMSKRDLSTPTGCKDVFYKFDGTNGDSDKKFM
jgi:hypothetical protein